jgi:transposase-like protein
MARRPPQKFERTYLIFTQDERLKIVHEIESGQLSFREALTKYNIINKNTLRSWLLKYGSNPNSILKSKTTPADRRRAAYQVIYKEATPAQVAAQMGVGLFSIWAWVRKYRNEVNQNDSPAKEGSRSVQQSEQKSEIENLKLKVAALEMMIDIAEKELNIDIRKKSGTKQ